MPMSESAKGFGSSTFQSLSTVEMDTIFLKKDIFIWLLARQWLPWFGVKCCWIHQPRREYEMLWLCYTAYFCLI